MKYAHKSKVERDIPRGTLTPLDVMNFFSRESTIPVTTASMPPRGSRTFCFSERKRVETLHAHFSLCPCQEKQPRATIHLSYCPIFSAVSALPVRRFVQSQNWETPYCIQTCGRVLHRCGGRAWSEWTTGRSDFVLPANIEVSKCDRCACVSFSPSGNRRNNYVGMRSSAVILAKGNCAF